MDGENERAKCSRIRNREGVLEQKMTRREIDARLRAGDSPRDDFQ
jgi:hypothetical protein